MALFDDTAKEIVVRIIYAGPPLAGKTETVRALAKMLLGDRAEGAMYSPSEAQGRTLYFDWLSYVGGSFKGNKVRCQIISVPGQDALSERRQFLIQEADAIVFVIDSTPEGLKQGQRYFSEIQPWLSRAEPDPPVGVVIQANKRDLPDSLNASEIKQLFGDELKLTVYETTATLGTGIREAFVMCVSQALARVGKLMNMQRLPVGVPDITSGDELLARIEAREKFDQPAGESKPVRSSLDAIAGLRNAPTSKLAQALSSIPMEKPSRSTDTVAAKTLEHASHEPPAKPAAERTPAPVQASALADEPASADKPAPAATVMTASTPPPPAPPDGTLHAGTIWPPVAGRLALHELTEHSSVTEYQEDGTWLYSTGPWRLRSRPENVFGTAGEALRVLLVHAHRHREMEAILSSNRCLALTPANGQGRRLWEIYRIEKTLDEALNNTLNYIQSPLVLADEIVQIAGFLVKAAHAFAKQKIPLQAKLSHIGKIEDQPVYLGFIPDDKTERLANSKIDVDHLIRSQFDGPVTRALSERTFNIPILLRAMQQLKNNGDADADVVDTLSALFIGQ